MASRRQAVIVGLLLLWLALSGGYSGWQIAPLVLINAALAAALFLWLAFSRSANRLDGVSLGLLLFALAHVVSAAANNAWADLPLCIAPWLAYMALYRLSARLPDASLRLGAVIALLPLALFSLARPGWENENVVAFSLVGLAFMVGPVAALVVLPGVVLGLNSIGGGLAIAAGMSAWWPSDRRLVLASAALPLLPLAAWVNPGGLAWRARFLGQAAVNFMQSPLVGIGPNRFEYMEWWHAHNLVATTAAELGLVGLVALGWLGWAIWQRRRLLPAWATGVVLALGLWSLIDAPLRFWGAGAIYFVALSRMEASR